MKTITIPESAAATFIDLQNGNSIEAKAIITEPEEKHFEKGKNVRVTFRDGETIAKIVSDPVVISDDHSEGRKTLSLVLESKLINR